MDLFVAYQEGDVKLVEKILSSQEDTEDTREMSLYIACENSHTYILEFFLYNHYEHLFLHQAVVLKCEKQV